MSLHIVGGYGIPAIPTKSVGQSWQSGYGIPAIPSYRKPYMVISRIKKVMVACRSSLKTADSITLYKPNFFGGMNSISLTFYFVPGILRAARCFRLAVLTLSFDPTPSVY